MSERLVFDTDVLIDYLCDHEAAAVFLEGCSQPLALSAISVAGLSVGVRDGEERSRLDEFIAAFETLPVDALIAVQAGLWRVTMAQPWNGSGGCADRGVRRPPRPPWSR